ncbi:MAG: TetR/AcrR family transcriptional regulator [Clostridia bacterium]|nr:TetR/AcrR family transcriptional regulator [Clostridia bacterium]
MDKIETALYYSENYDRRQIKTKKAIIGAFFALLQEKNISKITITELAKIANIDRKTFYLHYGSIADLYNDLGNMLVTLIKDEIIDYSTNNRSPYSLFANVNDIISEKIDLFKRIAINNDFSDFMLNIKDILCNELINLYGRANTSASERFKLTAEFIASGTIAMYLRWLKGDTNLTMDELALLASEMIINGASGLLDII